MITKSNVAEVVNSNYDILSRVQSQVASVKELGMAFRNAPIEAIKQYIAKHASLLMFPSNDLAYGGLVTYRDGRFYVHINTKQPKVYENFIWAHEFYHLYFEAEDIKSSDVSTYADGSALNERERNANLFAAELLINREVLEDIYRGLCEMHPHDKLATQVIRLMPAFKLPYKALVIKLAQDKLIEMHEAEEIIDYPYQQQLPADFDSTLLLSSNSIQFDGIEELLQDATVKGNMRATDYDTIAGLYAKHLTNFEKLL